MDTRVNPAPAERSKITVRDLNFYYGGFQALKKINLDLPDVRGPSFGALLDEARAWLTADAEAAALPFPRRVVAADGPDGRGIEPDDRVIETSRTPVEGLQTRLIWATEAGHDYRTAIADMPIPKGIAPLPGGSRFSILDIAPGHRGAARPAPCGPGCGARTRPWPPGRRSSPR